METIKLGIVGLGRAGRHMHLAEIADINKKGASFKIVAVCDTIEKRRLEVARECACKQYATIEELVKDEEVQMVDIATRSCDHYEHAKLAIKAKKDVFLEKPMACGYDEEKELFELAKKSGVKLYVRQNRRFEKKFLQVRDIIKSGILGDVYEIKLTRNQFALRNDWQTIDTFGGGQLLNWGPHIIDHALQFCDGDYNDIFTQTRQINASGNCEDHIKILLNGANGRIVDVEISSGVALPTPQYTVYGTRGMLVDCGGFLRVKHLPKDFAFEKLPADPSTPEAGTPGHFASIPKFDWVEEEFLCESDGLLNEIWKALYDDYVNGIPFPISERQVLKSMQVTEIAKKSFVI